jgi:hypothetical protein
LLQHEFLSVVFRDKMRHVAWPVLGLDNKIIENGRVGG